MFIQKLRSHRKSTDHAIQEKEKVSGERERINRNPNENMTNTEENEQRKRNETKRERERIRDEYERNCVDLVVHFQATRSSTFVANNEKEKKRITKGNKHEESIKCARKDQTEWEKEKEIDTQQQQSEKRERKSPTTMEIQQQQRKSERTSFGSISAISASTRANPSASIKLLTFSSNPDSLIAVTERYIV